MRNLKLKYNLRYGHAVRVARFLLVNPNSQESTDCRYIVTSNKLISFVPGVEDSHKVIAEAPDIVAAEYLTLDNTICLATGVGVVLLVHTDNQQVNEGTFCDVGIECMAWSPDQEVVVFVTKQHNVVVMDCTFEPLTEHPLGDDKSEVEGEFVNVGWGKKETQFHGSEGKQAATRKLEQENEKDIVKNLPKDVVVSWRADAAYFVVSYVSDSRGRTFKVFDKEGRLQYIAEKQPNIFHATCWRPSGNWIAVPQQLPNKSVIALFEKNGLRHRELVLPFNLQEESILDIKWSQDSEILTLRSQQRIYLYTISNYHWYLKQVLDFEDSDAVSCYCWDSRIGEEKTLHIMTTNGCYLLYKWHWAVDRIKSTVAVIDGARLLLTEFSSAIIPPPMCSQEIKLEANSYINSVELNQPEDAYSLYLSLYDSKHNVHNYTSSLLLPFNFTCNQIGLRALCKDMTPCQYGNLRFFELPSLRCLVASFTCDNTTTVQLIDINDGKMIFSNEIEGAISCMRTSATEEGAVMHYQMLDNKQIQSVLYESDGVSLRCAKRYHTGPNQNIDMMEVFFKSEDADGQIISLTADQSLYINEKRVATDVTSFCLDYPHVAFTKLSSLHILRLSDMKLFDGRRMERGSRLVTTVFYKVLVQMPRGNLEAVCPRVLSLQWIGNWLDEKSYARVFEMLRTQRINLNIICDHNMRKFAQNLNLFLETIPDPNWLSLFISDLQNEDFTRTMYAGNYEEDPERYPEGFKVENKITYVCEMICKRMEELGRRYRLPIITAYVKLNKTDKALLTIWEEKKRENCASGKGSTGGAEEALKHLLYLVDVNELFNCALSTYDFDLVLFVAQKSQKDPKEYLPFLNELKGYEPNYRKYKIDEHLKHYGKALIHIANCGKEKFVEALSFIKRHAYYTQALRAYQHQQELYQQICLAFADHLRANGKLDNAGILYERGGNLQQALLSAKHILDWRKALVLARNTQQNVATVAISMVTPLQEHGRYEEAYELSKTYAQNSSESLQCLIKGKLYLKAIYEVEMLESDVEKEEFVQTLIVPELLEYTSILVANIAADEELFVSHTRRLAEVRQKKTTQTDIESVDIDESDLLSDTTSMRSSRYTASSRGTGKTFRSSKNRRKHERKLLSLKPGNPFEDIALIDALHNSITRCFGQQQHIRDVCKALLQLQHDSEAYGLQTQFKKLLARMQDSLNDIWIEEMLPNMDYAQLQQQQRYAMLNHTKRFKPQLNVMDWEHDMLL